MQSWAVRFASSTANLSVDEKSSIACGAAEADKRDSEAVAKARRRIEAGRGGLLRLRAQIADCRTGTQIPAFDIESGKVGADLGAGKVFLRAGLARETAGAGPPKFTFPAVSVVSVVW
jgi:hypothetical protein